MSSSIIVSHPDPRSDPNDGSEPSSGRETIYWDSLPALSDVGMSKSYKCIDISYTKIYNSESHLHIQNYTLHLHD